MWCTAHLCDAVKGHSCWLSCLLCLCLHPPSGSWVQRLPADKADQCWERLLQIGQICQTGGDALFSETPTSRLVTHSSVPSIDPFLNVWMACRAARGRRCWTTFTTSCTGRVRPCWVWARWGRRTSWRTAGTAACLNPLRWAQFFLKTHTEVHLAIFWQLSDIYVISVTNRRTQTNVTGLSESQSAKPFCCFAWRWDLHAEELMIKKSNPPSLLCLDLLIFFIIAYWISKIQVTVNKQ